MQPYSNSKCSLSSMQIKGQYVSFQSSETCYPHEIFQELKFCCENLPAFAKKHKNFTCSRLISLLFHPQAMSATISESLSGQKMASLKPSSCLFHSLPPSVLPVSQTNNQLKNHRMILNKMANGRKRPFLHLVLSSGQEVIIPLVFRCLP